MGWLKAAMVICFASAAGVMAYAITTSQASPSAKLQAVPRIVQ